MADGVGEFVGAGHGLDYDVFLFYSGGVEGFEGAVEEGGDDLVVPAGVDDSDAQGAAVVVGLRGAGAFDAFEHDCGGLEECGLGCWFGGLLFGICGGSGRCL